MAELIAAFEERAAIIEFDGGMNRRDAEDRAAREVGKPPRWSGSILGVLRTGETT